MTVSVVMGSSLGVQAKKIVVPKMYMFGFAASFNDTIVHFTDVQEIDSVWIQKKNKFLLGREFYSVQLRNFLKQTKQMPNRTCVVFYDRNRTKAEKKYLKMKNLYSKSKDGKPHFDIRYLGNDEFRFKTIDMSEETIDEETIEQSQEKKNKESKRRKKRGK